eukprot:g67.t1
MEQQTRLNGGSGLTNVRQYGGGTRAFHEASYINSGAANIHSHANNKYTVGMGEIGAVLNGVHFTSRHNDYQLRMPSKTSNRYNAVEDVPLPPVPPAVLEKPTVAEQTEEMRAWFKAWVDQDHSVRDYRPYFKPVLSYLEGTWVKDHGELKEPFASDRHHIDAKTWDRLHAKTRFFMGSGNKHNAENLPVLPTRVMGMAGEKNNIPETANFEYTIKAIPLDHIPTDRLKPSHDLLAQLRHYPLSKTRAELINSRNARFELNAKNSSKWFDGQTAWEFMDDLMSQIPGKDNYNADLTDHVQGELAVNFKPNKDGSNSRLNTGFYSRYYGVGGKGASGRTRRKRGFNDGNLWAAMTSQPKVAGLKLDDGYGPVKCPLSKKCVARFVRELEHASKNVDKNQPHRGQKLTTDDDMWRAAAWQLSSPRERDCPNHAVGASMLSDTNYHRDEYLMCRPAITEGFRVRNKDHPLKTMPWSRAGKAPTFVAKDPSCGMMNPPLTNTNAGRIIGPEWKKCPREKTEQKWSWAIPLEIIYQTPLTAWNPYDLPYCTHRCKKPTANGRTGSLTDKAMAYDGNSRYSYYQTPIEFFNGEDKNPDAADTVKAKVGVLDNNGEIKAVSASGTWITLPKINGVADSIRIRYPVFPLHAEGSPIWKELKALEAVQLTGDEKMTEKVREEAMGITFTLTFANGHTHTVRVDGNTLVTKLGKKDMEHTFTSSLDNGHEHRITIKRVENNKFELVKLDPPEPHRLQVQGNVGSVKDKDTGLGTKSSAGGSWGSGSGSGGSTAEQSAATKKALDALTALNEKLTKRITALEGKLSGSATSVAKCGEMKDMKDMLASLTKAVADEQ